MLAVVCDCQHRVVPGETSRADRQRLKLSDQRQRTTSHTSTYERELTEQLVLALGTEKATEAPPFLIDLARRNRPQSAVQWQQRLETGGDVAAGRRVFFHPKSAACGKCHVVTGRGGRMGPNLTGTGRSWPRHKLIQKLLRPSPEIPLRYTNWSIVTNAGKLRQAVSLHAVLFAACSRVSIPCRAGAI